MGYGAGEVEVSDDDPGTNGQSSDARMTSAALGASGTLASSDTLIAGGTTALRAKGQLSMAQFEVEEQGLIDALTVDTHRLRLGLEATHARALAGGGRIAPSVEVGVRSDGGDGETGAGLEVGFGLRYAHPSQGLTVEGRGHVLAASEADDDEWGASFALQLDPGAHRRGLSLHLTSGYGATSGNVERMARGAPGPNGPTGAGLSGDGDAFRSAHRLDAELGYGMPALGAAGRFAPYSGLTLSDGGDRRYRLGTRWELDERLDLRFEGARRDRSVGSVPTAEHEIRLVGRLRF